MSDYKQVVICYESPYIDDVLEWFRGLIGSEHDSGTVVCIDHFQFVNWGWWTGVATCMVETK